MEKTLKQLAKELRARQALEQNLPELMNRVASAYGQLSLYNLAMELCMFLESETEGHIMPDKEAKEFKGTLFCFMKEALFDAYEPDANEAAVGVLISIRERMAKRMEILTAYTDLLTLYEYVVNRLEPKFEPGQENAGKWDDDAAAREALQWIFSEEENALTNEKIREMLSCLPVRMTKGKFVEMIERAFALYKDADRASIDQFAYILRSASGLYLSEGMAEEFPTLERIRNEQEEMLRSVQTKEEYGKWKQHLSRSTESLYALTGCYGDIQGILNALLTALLTRPYMTLEAEKKSAEIIGTLKQLCAGQNADAETLFAGTEQRMEKLSEEIESLEPLLFLATEGMEKEISALMLTAVHKRLVMAQRLNAGSLYAELSPEGGAELPEGYLEQVGQQFISEIKETLAAGPKLRNRAVMAAILRELPVFFHSSNEVMEYVRNSFYNCHDEGEKRISAELLRSYMY